MASNSQQLTGPFALRLTSRNGLIDKYFYFAMAVLIAAITIYGFHFTILENLVEAAVPRPLIVWVHAAVFTSWLILFLVQSGLVRIRRVSWHRTLGWLGLAIGISMPFLGSATAIVMDRFRFQRLHADPTYEANFLILQLNDTLLFAIFFALAALWRRKPDRHRRLMLIATCGLTSAAFGRFPSVAISDVYFYVLIDLLIAFGAIRDVLIDRRVHPVYRYALPALALEQYFVMYTYLHTLPWWTHIGQAILG